MGIVGLRTKRIEHQSDRREGRKTEDRTHSHPAWHVAKSAPAKETRLRVVIPKIIRSRKGWLVMNFMILECRNVQYSMCRREDRLMGYRPTFRLYTHVAQETGQELEMGEKRKEDWALVVSTRLPVNILDNPSIGSWCPGSVRNLD